MEYTPKTQEVRGLNYDDIKEAKATLSESLEQDGYGDLGLSIGIGGTEGSYKVCIRVAEQELVAFAEMAAHLYIPNVPIDVLPIGPVTAA